MVLTGSAVVVLGVVVCITLIRWKGTFSSSFSSGGAAYMSGVITFGGGLANSLAVELPSLAVESPMPLGLAQLAVDVRMSGRACVSN